MMVGDDEVDPQSLGSFGGRERANSGIDTNDQPNPGSCGTLDHVVLHAVAFPDAMRHVEFSAATAELDCGLENNDRGRAVDVVVAVNQNSFLAFNGRVETIQGYLHAGHQVRGVQLCECRRQEAFCGRSVLDVSHNQQAGEGCGHANSAVSAEGGSATYLLGQTLDAV